MQEAGALDEWAPPCAAATPRTALALVLVLDQFARHVHRRDRSERPDALAASDARALEVVGAALQRGWHLRLSCAELAFLLMPLRHSPSVLRLEQALALAREGAQRGADAADVLRRFEVDRPLLPRELHV